MNKTIQWILNVIFIIAIVMLWLNPSTEAEEEKSNEEKPNFEEVVENKKLQVRYINTDTIWSKYEYVKAMREDLQQKQNEYRADLESRLSRFEKEVMTFQEEAPKMSRFEGEQKQKQLMQKEQELGRVQEELSVKLMDMEDKMKRDIRKSILKQLKSYQTKEVDMILDFSSNSSLMMIEDSLNITDQVVKELNTAYQASKTDS
ncbi:MAG: OmpH family outer membrane protein [Vicingaceae bacterium]